MRAGVLGLCASALLVAVGAASAAPLTPGNFAVVRVGTGAAALSGVATATFIDEYTPAGLFVQSIPMPTAVSGANKRLTNSGTATSEAFLNRAVNGSYLVLGGYDADPGTTGIAATTSAVVNRVVGRVAMDGTVDTSTALSDAYSTSNIRSVATADGTAFWTGGTGSPGTSAGVRYAAFGATTSTQLAATPTNVRVVNIFGGQLMTSAASGTFQGVSNVGTGLPTATGQTITALPGFPTATGPSNYDYYLFNPTTLYVADDRAPASGGGLQKWTFNGTTWSLAYTMNTFTAPAVATGIRSLDLVNICGVVTPSPIFVATTTDNRIVVINDIGVATNPIVVAVTGATNTAFRGIRQIPCPPPCVSPVITTEPADLTVTEPAAATFSVAATSATALTYQWFYNGNALNNGGAISGATTATLTINPTATTDTGLYSVIVSNGCLPNATSRSAQLTVNAGSMACNVADIVSVGGLPPPDGLLTGDDFNAFINAFASSDTLADIVSVGGLPPPDGLITGDDFNAFINAFATGCP